MGTPVVTVAAGGLPVVDVTSTTGRGLPVAESPNGLGLPITVVPQFGMPICYDVPPAPSKPAVTVLPYVSGSPVSGQNLTTTTGAWLGTLPITYAFQWQQTVSGTTTPIAGATSQAITLTNALLGANITCAVTASNSVGTAAPAISNSVGPVTNTVAPAVPAMTWVSPSSNVTPLLSVNLPSGVGDGTDAVAGDILHIQYEIAAVLPAAPLLTLTSASTDNTPSFYVDLPSGTGTGTDAVAGDILHVQYE